MNKRKGGDHINLYINFHLKWLSSGIRTEASGALTSFYLSWRISQHCGCRCGARHKL